MNLESKIRRVVEPYLAGKNEEVHGLSPCVLKQILQELALFVFPPPSGTYTAIVATLEGNSLINVDALLLSAPPYVQWLCKQYASGPLCSKTSIEYLVQQQKIDILRGGLRQIGMASKIRQFVL